MTSHHHVLESVRKTPIGQLAELPLNELDDLLKKVGEQVAYYKQINDWLKGAVEIKYHKRFEELRSKMGKPTGTVHIDEDGYQVTEVISKKVVWDENELQRISQQLAHEGKDPADYISVSYFVPEKRYKDFEASIKSRFEGARTVMEGGSRLTFKQEG